MRCFKKETMRLIISTFALTLFACNSTVKNSNQTDTSLSNRKVTSVHNPTKLKEETFDIFFNKFKVDSVTQKSRIVFPLNNIHKTDEGEMIKVINKNDWKYTNFLLIKKLILTKKVLNQEKVSMLLSIEDTGVNVNYIFEKKAGQWWLTSIVDDSD